MGLGPASDPVPQVLIPNHEDGSNQRTSLTGRFGVGDVFESALHFGPFTALRGPSIGQMVLE